MMPDFATPQESFWAGDFGDEYPERNSGPELLAANLALFSSAFEGKTPPQSVIELGANIGLNLEALSMLFPLSTMSAVEINAKAVAGLRRLVDNSNIFHESILTWEPPARSWDLVLVKGVLIHLNPEALADVYRKMALASKQYVLICEYYNPEPVEVPYRGHSERLYKRDFCAEFIEASSEFRLINYGFKYRHDPVFADDDMNWFLLERRQTA